MVKGTQAGIESGALLTLTPSPPLAVLIGGAGLVLGVISVSIGLALGL